MLLYALGCYAQSTVTYKVDQNNGLPSSRIYGMMTDRHGYLWLSTPKGVVKYNGYDFKVFGQAQGLPSDDIWYTCEDSLGRIWISTISTEIGYIRNDKYTAAIHAEEGQLFYPKSMRSFGDGIAFVSPVTRDGRPDYRLFAVQGDKSFSFIPKDFGITRSYINEKKEYIAVRNDTVYKMLPGVDRVKVTPIRTFDKDEIKRTIEARSILLFKHYFISYEYKGRRVWFLDIEGKDRLQYVDTFLAPNDMIMYAYDMGDYFYICGAHNIYKLDGTLKVVKVIAANNLTGNRGLDNSAPFLLMENDFWGVCLGTGSGLYLNKLAENKFVAWNGEGLYDSKPVGCINDSVCYRWSNSRNLLIEKKGNALKYYKLDDVVDVKRIIPYDRNRSLLVDEHNVYWIRNDDKKTVNYFSSEIFAKKNFYSQRLIYPINAVAMSDSSLFGVFRGDKRFNRFAVGDSTSLPESIMRYRYDDLVYDSLRKAFWVYNRYKVTYFDPAKNNMYSVNKNILSMLGIGNVENIIVDNKYGNLLLKANDDVWLVDLANMRCRKLFGGYRLGDAYLYLYKSTVTVVGRFGVLFSRVEGSGIVSKPVLFENVKCSNYTNVLDAEISDNKIWLSTDKGFYTTDVPDSEVFTKAYGSIKDRYRFVISYGDSTYGNPKGSQVLISQDDMRIGLDIIHPMGYGKIKYQYKISGENTGWVPLNGTELPLHGLRHSREYAISIIAYDDIWRSRPATIRVYVQPYWWQTQGMTASFIICGTLLLAIIGIGISYVTQHIVTKRNARKNFFMELELKGIYSQINPHFIFNTLGTSLYYIKINKTKEAYNHITKFSRLLRTYISSSRNKMITIGDEVQNLKDYIELQQDRFINRFDYNIEVEETIGASTEKIPSLLIQPFVENAINHGLLNKSSKGNLLISFTQPHYGQIVCKVEDDGVGRMAANQLRESSSIRHQSFGNQLIQDLIHIYNTYENVKIRVEYIDKDLPDTGTIVNIYINKLTKNT